MVQKRCSDIPNNLTIALSAWPGLKLPENPQFPIVWYRDLADPDKRIPENYFYCPGNCTKCGYTCYTARIGDNIVIDKH